MSSLPLPSHYAQLVYVGSRPKPNNCCCEPPPNEFDVEHTPNLKLWLTKRNLTCGFFGSLILGLAPPKPPVIMESRKMSFKEVGTFIPFFSVKLQWVSSRFSHLTYFFPYFFRTNCRHCHNRPNLIKDLPMYLKKLFKRPWLKLMPWSEG